VFFQQFTPVAFLLSAMLSCGGGGKGGNSDNGGSGRSGPSIDKTSPKDPPAQGKISEASEDQINRYVVPDPHGWLPKDSRKTSLRSLAESGVKHLILEEFQNVEVEVEKDKHYINYRVEIDPFKLTDAEEEINGKLSLIEYSYVRMNEDKSQFISLEIDMHPSTYISVERERGLTFISELSCKLKLDHLTGVVSMSLKNLPTHESEERPFETDNLVEVFVSGEKVYLVYKDVDSKGGKDFG
ncbi:MAG: hypothetical protein HQK53_20035, partial [Oligoflexia bacterium]|nr:hypothetical protein [Oligoflexia bacterium]